MAKKLDHQSESANATDAVASPEDDTPLWTPEEYDLVDEIVFDPPLSREERRRIYGLGMTMEERLAMARRQIAAGDDGF